MSAPDTNLETEKRRHAVPRLVLIGVVVVTLLGFAGLVVWVSGGDDTAAVSAPAAAG